MDLDTFSKNEMRLNEKVARLMLYLKKYESGTNPLGGNH